MFGEQAACMEYAGMNPGGGVNRVNNLLKSVDQAVRNAVGPGDGGLGPDGPGSGGDTYNAGAGTSLAVRGSEITFPLRDPYKPITNTRSPVTGMNAYPRYKLRNPRYYGFAGLGQDPYGQDVGKGYFPSSPTIGTVFSPQPSSPPAPSRFEEILRTIQVTLPATISAVKGRPYYNPAQSLQPQYTMYGQPISGQPGANIGAQVGAATGNIADTLANIVQEHPLLVLGGGAALLLLFMSPPRRR